MAILGPEEFAKKAVTDPKFLIELMFVLDLEQELSSKGYELSPNFIAYITSTLDKMKAYITDQGHVLEIKSKEITSPMSVGATRSGNGAPGTGW
ncbi:hypothetical protein VXP84_00260 [Acinetobacter oleivorans]|uniref:hypothetical protein n=1 Tax=Acinetobacter oleivorans TaxID=1148157 RepID=UPI003A899656